MEAFGNAVEAFVVGFVVEGVGSYSSEVVEKHCVLLDSADFE